MHIPQPPLLQAPGGLLAEAGVELQIIKYLKHPPSRDELAELVAMLGLRPSELVRRSEAVFRQKYAQLADDDDER